MNTDAEPERGVWSVSDAEVGDGAQQMQRHRRHLAGVPVAVTYRQPAHDHVRVANRLNFIDVVAFDDRVEQCVQVVQHVYHLNSHNHPLIRLGRGKKSGLYCIKVLTCVNVFLIRNYDVQSIYRELYLYCKIIKFTINCTLQMRLYIQLERHYKHTNIST